MNAHEPRLRWWQKNSERSDGDLLQWYRSVGFGSMDVIKAVMVAVEVVAGAKVRFRIWVWVTFFWLGLSEKSLESKNLVATKVLKNIFALIPTWNLEEKYIVVFFTYVNQVLGFLYIEEESPYTNSKKINKDYIQMGKGYTKDKIR